MLKKSRFDTTAFSIRDHLSITRDEAVALVGISPSTQKKTLCAAWNGHEFEVLETFLSDYSETPRGSGFFYIAFSHSEDHRDIFASEKAMIVHYPIDPRITIEDVRGATVAYANADNTGWLFAHCDADFHLDHEDRLQGAVSAAFESKTERANKVFRDAVYDCFLVNDRGNQAAVFAWNRMVHNLNTFRDEVKAAVVAEAQTRHLGYFHQNPHEAHVHEPIQIAPVSYTHLPSPRDS